MNTIQINCFRCQTAMNAAAIGDGTYMTMCCNPQCKQHSKVQIVMLAECEACTGSIVGYEQDRPPRTKLPRIFMATCRNPACHKRGNTVSVQLPEKVRL
jgi:hypothetical protein